jgi:uncharacterized protein YqgV (UPF0045/DUF77 family)
MTAVSAQVSLYPLRTPRLSSAIDSALEAFRASALQVESGSMSTVVAGDIDLVFGALRAAFQRAIDDGEAVMVVTFSNACPVSGKRPR